MLSSYRTKLAFMVKTFALLLPILFLAKESYTQCSATAAFSHYFQQCSTVQFTDLSTAATNYNIVAWDWDFDDGGTSNLQNPVHTFAPGATYLVTLTVTADSAGVMCTDQVTNPVIVPALPDVFFTWDPEPTCLGDPTSFFGTSGNNIVSWYWDFDDGQFSTLQNPIHLYIYADTFNVSLSVIDVNGCSDTITHQVTVVEIPDVDFTIDPNPTCVNSVATFSGTSSSPIQSWDWDFGDGGSANTQVANHAYSSAGTYTVTLTVTDIYGCTNFTTQQLIVNPLPDPDFTHTAPSCTYDSVFFNNFSTSPNGYITTWEWDFGDGNVTTVNFPDNPNVAHLYDNNGTYQVTLTVTDSDSCMESTFRQVIIVPKPIADFNNSNACDGTPVDFTDLSSQNGGSNIVSWYWEFGDPASGVNNTSTLQNPSHLFTSAGTYDITMIIENTDDCTDTLVKTISVNDKPYVEIATDSDSTCVNEITNFYGSGTDIISWFWEFGDGGTSVQQNPQHAFLSSGTYTVTLTVEDVNGCTNDTTRLVYVNPLPFADFNHSVPSCSGSVIDFFDLSSSPNGYLDMWHWYFGDGTDTVIFFPDNPDVSHIYNTAGSYIVSLAVTNSNGCVDSAFTEISIDQGPEADFVTGDPPCEDNLIQFLDQSLGFGYSIQSWFWNFGDPSSGSNNTSTLQNPYHLYENSGVYTVYLEVMSSNGCVDTITQDITINAPPNVFFNSTPSTHCFGDTVYFAVNPDSTDLGAIVGYFWDFGDPGSGSSDTSSLPNPWHIFTSPGTFYVTLTVIDTNGCDNSVAREIIIHDIPTADFRFVSNCADDSTRFWDESLNAGSPISSWEWDFGDPASGNNTSTLQNPYHEFTDIGTYFTTLMVTDNRGCSDEIIKNVTVFDNPNASFNYQQVCNPVGTVFFNDSSFVGGSGSPIVEWLWELDEGYFSSEVNPVYTYPQPETWYEVSLTVTDENGCTNTIIDSVYVFENIEVDFQASRVCFRERTDFTTSFTPANDSVLYWTWNFGDGTSPMTTIFDTISHYYNKPGTYVVTVRATDIHDCVAETYGQVIVDSLPVPRFEYDTAFCNRPTNFSDISLGGGSFVNSWFWDFGDPASGLNNFATIPNPSHIYAPEDSTYYVKLIVTNANGCTDSIVQEVIKGPCVVASFEVITDPVCTNSTVCFRDNSVMFGNTGMISNWYWDFGDGNTLSYSFPTDSVCHEFTDPGTYRVMQVVTGSIQSADFSDTAFLNVRVNPAPIADFSFDVPCTNHNTVFNNETDNNGTVVNSWSWEFGDPEAVNDTSTAKNPTFRYSDPGFYNVKLTALNDYGCIDSISDTVEIFNPPLARFDYSLACENDPTEFFDISDTSGTAISSWRWNFGDPNSTRDTSSFRNPVYLYDSAGTYNVSFIVRDFYSCTDTLEKQVDVNPVPFGDFTVIKDFNGIQGRVKCVNSSTGAVYYEWDFGNGETSEEENPVTNFTEGGVYVIQMVAWNEFSCPDTVLLEFELLFKGLYVPNAFAPNSTEGELRKWKPVGYNLRSFRVEVYSMWGNLLWFSRKLDKEGQPTEAWDGTYEGKPMPSGNYVWKAFGTFKDNTIWPGQDEDGSGNYKKTGTITLIR